MKGSNILSLAALVVAFKALEQKNQPGIKGDAGPAGPAGPKGPKGDTGEIGPRGKDVYDYLVENGYEGTEEDFKASLNDFSQLLQDHTGGRVAPNDFRFVSGKDIYSAVFDGVSYSAGTNIDINIDGYAITNGSFSGSQHYGHKRTDYIEVRKGDIVDYGVNTYNIIGSVSVVSLYDNEKVFVKYVKRLDESILNSFFEGRYEVEQDGYVIISSYEDANWGESYVTHRSKVTLLNGLNSIAKRSRIQISNIECYNRGGAITSFSNNKKIGIIVAGQSNADGRVPIAEAPEYITNNDNTVPGVLMWNHATKTFEAMKYGVNSGADSNTSEKWAFDAVAGYMLSQSKSENVYLIKRTKGGTAIDPNGIDGGGWWTPYTENISSGNKLIEELKDRVVTAMNEDPDLEIKAVLWHQGESDSIVSEYYYENLLSVISYIRGVCRNPKLPFILGTISENSSQYNSEVDEAMRKVSEEDAFVYIVDMKDGTLLDPYHFDASATLTMGEQIFNILDNIL